VPQKPPRGTARGPPQLVLPPPPPYPPPDTDVVEPLCFPGEGAASQASELRPKRMCLMFPFQLCVDHSSLWSLLMWGWVSRLSLLVFGCLCLSFPALFSKCLMQCVQLDRECILSATQIPISTMYPASRSCLWFNFS
jgi:hypothetical protein